MCQQAIFASHPSIPTASHLCPGVGMVTNDEEMGICEGSVVVVFQ